MGAKIHIPADEVWSFYTKNKERCTKEMIAIAENKEIEYVIYLTEDNGYPLFCVCKGNNDPEYEEGAIDEKDCAETARRCFFKYLFPIIENNDKITLGTDDSILEDLVDQEDIIYEREDELHLAMGDFLQTVLKENGSGAEIIDLYGLDMVDEILDFILHYLTTKYCFKICRPMIITEDDMGNKIYVEYPYE